MKRTLVGLVIALILSWTGAARAQEKPAEKAADSAKKETPNPELQVLVLNGTYDLATPFFATECMVSHLGLEKKLQSHIQMKYYPAGHMMYVQEQSLKDFKRDLAAFIDATDRL